MYSILALTLPCALLFFFCDPDLALLHLPISASPLRTPPPKRTLRRSARPSPPGMTLFRAGMACHKAILEMARYMAPYGIMQCTTWPHMV